MKQCASYTPVMVLARWSEVSYDQRKTRILTDFRIGTNVLHVIPCESHIKRLIPPGTVKHIILNIEHKQLTSNLLKCQLSSLERVQSNS